MSKTAIRILIISFSNNMSKNAQFCKVQFICKFSFKLTQQFLYVREFGMLIIFLLNYFGIIIL